MSQSELRQCRSCKQNFTIESDDFDFYKKIDVPPPTRCPECRMIRRIVTRPNITLYWANCALCNKKTLSMYSVDKPYTVFCMTCWYSDKWDPMSYGIEYDFSKPFFEQFKELSIKVPRPALSMDYATIENSEYTNQVDHVKNCYLIFNSAYNELCSYCHSINRSKESIDSMYIDGCELTYEGLFSDKIYHSAYIYNSKNCVDSYFLKDCTDCANCFGCFGLKSKQFYIWNEPYSKEEYLKKIESMQLDKYSSMLALKQKATDFWLKFPVRFSYQNMSKDVTGNRIYESKNCKECFIAKGVINGKYTQFIETGPAKDVMDYSAWGDNAELIYECSGCGDGVNNLKFCSNSWQSMDMMYTVIGISSSHLFGCVGLRKKSYCILNKQYSEKDFESLREKIIQHMRDVAYVGANGVEYKFGEFFPPEIIAGFAYNESISNEWFPMSKEKALKNGYGWKMPEARGYTITKKADELPDSISGIDESILKETIECINNGKNNDLCSTAFKIIPTELQFYKKMNLPMPRLCPNCRYAERIKLRNPLKLWHRTCMKEGCTNEFQTSYDPSRPEIVYCETCYQNEVN